MQTHTLSLPYTAYEYQRNMISQRQATIFAKVRHGQWLSMRARKFQTFVIDVLDEHRENAWHFPKSRKRHLFPAFPHIAPCPTHSRMLKISQRLHFHHIVCIWINFKVFFGESFAILMANILPRHFTLALFVVLCELTHIDEILANISMGMLEKRIITLANMK